MAAHDGEGTDDESGERKRRKQGSQAGQRRLPNLEIRSVHGKHSLGL
jgi:hypothetical protein